MNLTRRDWLLSSFGVGVGLAQSPRKLNVLMIAVDDLNNRLHCYGDQVVKTPNIDRLAKLGVRFDRSYCNYPLCNPSRTSLLSSLRPDKTKILNNNVPPRTYIKDAVMLPEYFHNNGYFTARVGKIAHGRFEDAVKWDISEFAMRGEVDTKQARKAQKKKRERAGGGDGEPGKLTWLQTDNRDEQEPDGHTAVRISELIEKNRAKPFFIAAGFHKPHLPWVAPKKYFDMYKPEMITLPDTPADDLDDIPPIALTHTAGEKGMSELERKKAICAYHAATTFMDAQVGVLLNTMDRLKLWNNTVVFLFGDHGWHLNEHHGLWRKMTVFEQAARAPLIMAAPGRQKNAACPRLVEWVDFYPTLAELCGLPKPKGLDGTSFVPLLDNPQRPWKKAAYTVVQHGSTLGRSVRTERYRYTEWGTPSVAELYDHEGDPKEYRNLAKDPKQANVIRQLQLLLNNPDLAKPGA
ncbi:MAG: sulfatase [Candidatus Solibacter usitatus]|nr:sulfatase [Candidatus Solibacter usitatus]